MEVRSCTVFWTLKEGAEAIRQTLARIDEVARERETAYARWVELDERGT